MKKYSFIVLCVLIFTLTLSSCGDTMGGFSVNVDNLGYYEQFKDLDISINVYNWGEYISDGSEPELLDVNREFEALTGINVNYTTYATNEELYAKLKGGGADYDIIIPSEYMVSRMIQEDMLEEINYADIPNTKNLMESFLNLDYDKENRFSVPYMWGTVGIIYDKESVTEENIGWDILWNEKYAGNILMFDNPRDAFAIAQNMLGYSMNTENEEELKAAYEKLKEQKPLVQAYVMDQVFDKMGAGEAVVAPYYAGDAVTLMADYENLGFAIPKSGTNLFVDAICIPKGSKNKDAAMMYINFLCEPEVGLSNCKAIGYSTPLTKTFEMLDDEIKNDGISYPDATFQKEKCTAFVNLSEKSNKLMQDLWTEMKSAQ